MEGAAASCARRRPFEDPLSIEDGIAFARALDDLEVEVDDQADQVASDEVLALALEHGLSAYDAAYLELADRREAPLATADAGLARAAREAGVKLFLEA